MQRRSAAQPMPSHAMCVPSKSASEAEFRRVVKFLQARRLTTVSRVAWMLRTVVTGQCTAEVQHLTRSCMQSYSREVQSLSYLFCCD